MESKIIKYKAQVIKALAEKNIFYQENVSSNDLLHVGVLLNILTENKVLQSTIGIYQATTEVTECKEDYCIVFRDKNNGARSIQTRLTGECVDLDTLEEGEFKAINVYFQTKKLDIKCSQFICEDQKIAVIECGYLSSSIIMQIATLLPRFIPGFFSKEEVIQIKDYLATILTQKPHEVFEKLEADSYIDWVEIAKKEQYDAMVRCVTYAQKRRVEQAERDVDDYRRQANEYYKRYCEYIDLLNDKEVILMAYRNNETDIDSDIHNFFDYLQNNRAIKNIDQRNNYLLFEVETEMRNYDIDAFKLCANSTSKHLYSDFSNNEAKDWLKLMQAIFLERKYDLMVSASLALKMDNHYTIVYQGLDGLLNVERLREKYPNTIPAPHAALLHCPGSFPNLWTEAFEAGNMIGGINYAIAWVQNINWNDGVATRNMVAEMRRDRKCIKDKATGEMFTAAELIAKLKEE